MKNFSIVFIFSQLLFWDFPILVMPNKNKLYFEKYDVKSGLPESSVNYIQGRSAGLYLDGNTKRIGAL